MDFETAVLAHGEWRVKLVMFINESGRLAHEFAGNDRQCSLGCWLYGEGKRYQLWPEFQDFKEDHAEFHRMAADVVQMVKEGRKQDAKECISPGGDFFKLLMQIDEGIVRLRNRVHSAA